MNGRGINDIMTNENTFVKQTDNKKMKNQESVSDANFSCAEHHFHEWARQNTIEISSLVPVDDDSDLEVIAAAIGSAKFVALSEGFHNCKEMMSLHHRIIRYLVENHGFNTILTESGLPESRLIHEYVQGGDPSVNMWDKGLNKMYGAWKEGRELIEYMRSYNVKHGNIVQYYGVDIGGFYRDWKSPLDKILEYIKTVDEKYYKILSQKLDPYINLLSNKARLNYSEHLNLSQKDDLARILNDAVDIFNRNEEAYVCKGNDKEFQWARQSMISMQLAENYYRNYDNMKCPETSKYVGLNGREIAMARNSLWVLGQRKDAKVIWIDHVIHTKTKSQLQDGVWGNFTPAGQLLKQALGNDYFSIGMVYKEGKFWNKWQTPSERYVDDIPPTDAKRLSFENSLAQCGNNNFFLNFKDTPTNSFECSYWMQNTFSMRENDYFIQIEPREWDSCVFLSEANPATPVESTDE